MVVTASIEQAAGERVYVVGDVHGCPDEPAVLLRHLEEAEGLSNDDLVIFLGDYIDRGPDSKAVIDLMLDFKVKFPQTRFLKGNHEEMLEKYLSGEVSEPSLRNQLTTKQKDRKNN